MKIEKPDQDIVTSCIGGCVAILLFLVVAQALSTVIIWSASWLFIRAFPQYATYQLSWLQAAATGFILTFVISPMFRSHGAQK